MTFSTEKGEGGGGMRDSQRNEGQGSEIPMVNSRGNAVRKKKSAKE